LLVGTVTGGISLFLISRVKVPLPEDVFYTTFLPVKVSLADFLIALAFELLLITIFPLVRDRNLVCFLGKAGRTKNE